MPTISLDRVTVTKRASIDAQGARVYLWTYFVEASAPDATEIEVGAILPKWGDAHPDDASARCTRVEAQQTKELYHWECEVEFTTEALKPDKGTRRALNGKSGGGLPSSPGGNTSATAPNLRPWVFTWSSSKRSEHLFHDRSLSYRDGDNRLRPGPKPAVTSAGQPFDTGLEIPCVNPVLHITAFKLAGVLTPGDKIKLFVNSVNSRPWGGWDAQEVLCTDYKETSVYEQGAWFWQVDVTLEFKKGGWNPVKILNAGTMIRIYDAAKHSYRLEPIKDRYNNPITTAMPLSKDGSEWLGGPREEGKPDWKAEDLIPNYIEFNIYDQADFKYLI